MKLFFALAGLATGINANAQLGGGARLGYDLYFGGSGIKTVALGGFGEWSKSDEVGIRFGLNYGLPNTVSDIYTAHALNNYSIPQSIQVDGDFKASFLHLYVDGKKYFGNSDYDDGGFYFTLGAGYTFAMTQADYDYGIYSSDIYTVTGMANEEDKQFAAQIMVRAFLGYDYSLDFAHLFGEFGLSFPATDANGVAIPIELPPFVEFSAGIRF
ncbi:MAG: hypothetical protein HYZ14_09130 [Bacteroidetes bacterium]|nr:hypothetical protein [Bacteroidota bacterium]